MTISAELQRIYASAPVNTPFYDALVLSHSQWESPMAYITNTVVPRTFELNGELIEFQPATFTIKLPRRDDTGLVDFEITFPLSYSAMKLIELAEPDDETITAILTTYIDGETAPQMEPVELQLDNIALGTETGTGRAQRIDLLNKSYPRNIVRPTFYRGLWR